MMVHSAASPIGRHLIATGNRLVRTRDLAGQYAQPSNETARLVRNGVLLKVANGYFLVVPEHRRDGTWRPAIEDLAMALGLADYGLERSALLGPSAARVLGAIPRALSSALLAAPVHRSPLETRFGRIVFSTRDTQRLDLQRHSGELATGFCTTPEQTILDLATNPTAAGISEVLAAEARATLFPMCDLTLVARLAKAQRNRKGMSVVLLDAERLG
jgi:hypothetical protein